MKIPFGNKGKDENGHCVGKHTKKRRVDKSTTFAGKKWETTELWTCKKCRIAFFSVVTSGYVRNMEN